MKTFIKDSKKGGFRGYAARRNLKFALGAAAFMMLVGALFICTGSAGGIGIGVALATAPFVGFVLPDSINLGEEEKKGMQELAKYLTEHINKLHEGSLTDAKFQEKINKEFARLGLSDDTIKGIQKALDEQGLWMAKHRRGADVRETFSDKLKSFIESDDFKNGIKSQQAQSIEIKAATTIMTPNASTNAPHALTHEIIPGIQEAPRERTFLFPLINKGNTNSRTLTWINRVNKEGGAAIVEEGAVKPLKDWEYKEESSVAKKIAVSTKVSMEMLQDFPYMESEIRMLLNRDLLETLDLGILDEVTTGASSYVGTDIDGTIPFANDADAIRALMLQQRNLNYVADIAVVNPSTAAALDLLKSENGNYIRLEVEGILRRIQIIESAHIPAGSALMMDTAKLFARILQSIRLEFGWENDDFRKNLVLIVAELRLHNYRNSIDQGAVIFEELATVKAALQKV